MTARTESIPFRRTPRRQKVRRFLAVTAAVASTAPSVACAAIRYWVDGNNFWTANFWSSTEGGPAGASVPGNGDVPYIAFDDATSRTVTFNNPTPITSSSIITIDNRGTGTSILSQSQGTFGGPTSEFVGYQGNGAYVLNGGTNAPAFLHVGNTLSGHGTYTLGGTGLLATQTSYIGYNGAGSFNQSAGTHTASATLTLGQFFNGTNAASSGTYTMSGGSLTVGDTTIGTMTIGGHGVGTVNHSAGAVTTYDLILGSEANGTNAASTGSYSMTGTASLTIHGGLTVGDAGTGTFTQNAGSVTLSNTNNSLLTGLTLGRSPTGSGTYTLNSGTLTLPEFTEENIGLRGTGTVVQNGGTNNAALFTLGYYAGAHGSYTLKGGTLNSADQYVGFNGVGTFSQTNGANVVAGYLYLGMFGQGTLNLAGGTLSVGNEVFAGDDAPAGINQTGGTFNVGHWLFVGHGFGDIPLNDHGGFANYTLSGGTLNAPNQSIGFCGTNLSTFTQTGGTNNATNNIVVSDYAGGRGRYDLQNGTVNTYGLYVAWSGDGTFNQSGGANTAHVVVTGYRDTGAYNMTGGTLNATDNEYVGWFADGTFNQSAGTHTARTLQVGVSANGTNPASTGLFNLTGGNLTVTASEQIGVASTGTFVQDGGVHNVTSTNAGGVNGLLLGVASHGVGQYTLNTGSLTVATDEFVGSYGSGLFNQNGGAHTVGGHLYVGILPGSSGVYNLAGGTLNANVASDGTFTFSGGAYTGDFVNAGTFDFTAGTFGGTLTQGASGTLNVNGSLSVSGGVTNAGNINIVATSGQLTVLGTGLNNNGGSINLLGGALSCSGAINSNGGLTGYGAVTGSNTFTNNGLISQGAGNLTLASSGGTINNGQITLAAGRQLLLSTHLLNNAAIDLAGGILNGPSALENNAAGVITGPGTIAAPLTNAGTLLLPAGQLHLLQPLVSSGKIELNDFTAHLTGAALSNTGSLQGRGIVSNAIVNDGTIEVVGGTLTLASSLDLAHLIRRRRRRTC